MQTRQWALSLVGGLTVMSLIGCYSHYPSSVYGPGGQPGAYGVPQGGAYPQGGSYVLPPGGTPIQGSGTSLAPSGTYESQSPSASGSDNRWQPPGGAGGDAPAYNPADEGRQNPVPDYKDPAGGGFDAPSDFGGDTEDFGGSAAPGGAAPSGTPAGGEEPMSPFDSFDGSASLSGGDAQFVEPELSFSPVASVRNVVETSITAAGPSPYKYDKKHFRWLRGVVDYDAQEQTWNIIYDVEPDEQDQYGGSIVLSGVGQRDSLQNDDIVLVEGAVDPKLLDAFGKPMFRVDRLTRLEPLSQIEYLD